MSSLAPIRARARGSRTQHADAGPPDFGRATRGPRRPMRAPLPLDPHADDDVVDDMAYSRAPMSKRFSRSSASGMPPSSSFHDAIAPSDGNDPFIRTARAESPDFVDAPGAPSGPASAGGVAGRVASAFRRRLSRTGGLSGLEDPATATGEKAYAPPATLKNDDFPPRRHRPSRMDVIDTLDNTGLRGNPMFHHDSAYDAVSPRGAAAFKHGGRMYDDEPHRSSESAGPETYLEGAEEIRNAPRAVRSRAPPEDNPDFPPVPLQSSRPGHSARARNARTLDHQGERGVYSRQQSRLASRGLFADMAPEELPMPPQPSPGPPLQSQSSQGGHPTRMYDQFSPSNNPQAEMWGHAEEPWSEFAEAAPKKRNGSEAAAGMYSQSSGNSSRVSMEAAMRAGARNSKHRLRALNQTYGSEFDEQPPSPHENMPSRPRNKRSKSFLKLVGMKKPEPFAMQAPIDQIDDNSFQDPFPGAWPGAAPASASARRSTSRQRQDGYAQDEGNRKARSVRSFRSALSRKTSTDGAIPSPATDEGTGLGSRLRRIASRSSLASKSQGDDESRGKLPRRSSVRQSITTLARRMSLGGKTASESEDDGRAAYARTGAYESESDGDLDASGPVEQPVRRGRGSLPPREAPLAYRGDMRGPPRSRSRGRGPQAPPPPGFVHPQAELFSREVRARPVDRSAVRTRPARNYAPEIEHGSSSGPSGSASVGAPQNGVPSSRRSERSARSVRSELKPTKASLRKISTAATGARSEELEENPEYMSAARSISGRSGRSGRSGQSAERRLSTGARSQRSGGAVSDYTGDNKNWTYEQPAVSTYGYRAPQAFRADPRDDIAPIEAAPKTSLLGKLTRKGSRKVAAL